MNDLNPSGLVSPPAWSLAIGGVGRFCVWAAAALFAIAAIAWLLSKKMPSLQRVGMIAFTAAATAIIGAFVALGALFVDNRFEYEYVFGHADSKNAIAYRIAGIWSGQEGSFLLWGTCAAIFALVTVRRTGLYRRWYTIASSFFLGGIASILAFESPFHLNMFEGKPVVPIEGLGLAPSLQNYWVVIHPPTIFLGFGSLTALFALAFAAMVEKDYDSWIPIVRPWAIVSVSLVGLGLCMGGFWAYETLGWGGFWMWDPVENVSFVPWCFVVALIHGVLVQNVKKKWQITNLLFGGLPFLVFVYGTFLTRSGFLSDASVHSFAEMDRSALKLLIVLMGGSTLGFFGLWAVRAFQSRGKAVADEGLPVRREAFYMMGIAAVLMLGIATMIGMSVPLFQALQGQKAKVVPEGLYHQVLPWIFVPIMILMGITPFVSWRGMKGRELWSKVYTVLCVTIGLTGLTLFATVVTSANKKIDLNPTITMLGKYEVKGLSWIVFLVGICYFVFVANAWRILDLWKRSKLGTAPFLAHMGVAILMAGLIVSRGFEQKDSAVVMKDHPGRLLSYEVRYAGMTSTTEDRNNKVRLEMFNPHTGSKTPEFTATPGLYYVEMADGQKNAMVWPHIQRGLLMDTYIALGQPQTDASQDISMSQGETIRFGELLLTYEKFTRDGEAGVSGTKFGAMIKVEGGGHSETINPQMELGKNGPVHHPSPLGTDMQLSMVAMNAADKSVTLRVQLTTPMYPVEIYHKPLTILVWLGTGLLALSGFASAFYRRQRVAVESNVGEPVRPATKPGDLVHAMQGETS